MVDLLSLVPRISVFKKYIYLLLCRFHSDFYNGKSCEIEFSINPNPWWARNRAILLSRRLLEDFLFPTELSLANYRVSVISRLVKFLG